MKRSDQLLREWDRLTAEQVRKRKDYDAYAIKRGKILLELVELLDITNAEVADMVGLDRSRVTVLLAKARGK